LNREVFFAVHSFSCALRFRLLSHAIAIARSNDLLFGSVDTSAKHQPFE